MGCNCGKKKLRPMEKIVKSQRPIVNVQPSKIVRAPASEDQTEQFKAIIARALGLPKLPEPQKLERYNWKEGELRFVTTEQLVTDAKKLIQYVPSDCCGVITCFRSGAIPAGVVATTCHLPLWELTPTGLRLLGSGYRGARLPKVPEGTFILVDDTSHDGGQMTRARRTLAKHKVIYSAVYVKKPETVDCYAEILPSPHLLEWNLLGGGNGLLSGQAIDPRLRGFGMGLDFDGILCEDSPFVHKDSEEDRVVNWILNATPKYLPRYSEIPLVVSMRLEKHRPHIEAWLKKWGLHVKNLVLHPANSFSERDKHFNFAEHKGLTAAKFKTTLFIESDYRQGQGIARKAGCPVIVPSTAKVYLP